MDHVRLEHLGHLLNVQIPASQTRFLSLNLLMVGCRNPHFKQSLWVILMCTKVRDHWFRAMNKQFAIMFSNASNIVGKIRKYG